MLCCDLGRGSPWNTAGYPRSAVGSKISLGYGDRIEKYTCAGKNVHCVVLVKRTLSRARQKTNKTQTATSKKLVVSEATLAMLPACIIFFQIIGLLPASFVTYCIQPSTMLIFLQAFILNLSSGEEAFLDLSDHDQKDLNECTTLLINMCPRSLEKANMPRYFRNIAKFLPNITAIELAFDQRYISREILEEGRGLLYDFSGLAVLLNLWKEQLTEFSWNVLQPLSRKPIYINHLVACFGCNCQYRYQ